MTDDDRLRPVARDRLAASVHCFDLGETVAGLRAEAHASVAGHRQVTLAKHGPLTLLLFAFERDGLLKEHQTSGEVVIHVLRGRLSIDVDGTPNILGPGMLLTLTPGTRHAVHALEESEMLLSVVRSPASEGVSPP